LAVARRAEWTHPAAATARAKLARSHRFIWYDRLGCGLSDRSGFTPSVEDDVDQLEAVLEAADVERCSLVGYSWGGPAAATFAARHPERVDRLVLYATYARGAAVTTAEQHEAFTALLRSNWHLGTLALITVGTSRLLILIGPPRVRFGGALTPQRYGRR
jgi:pimeloyl-ACP methyl ester carboxylesterase